MKTSVQKIPSYNSFVFSMNNEIDFLRKEIWKTIHKFADKLSECDIAMALSLVNYELIHHSK